MRIVYLHQYFNTPAMPGGVRSYDIANHLVRNGHSVHMVTTVRDKSKRNSWVYSNEDGIHTHWLDLPYSNSFNFLRRLKAFLLFAFFSAKKGASIDCDIVYATSTPLTIAIPALYISWRKSVPLVFEVRDLWPEVPIAIGVLKNPILKYLARNLEKFVYKKSTSIIALSEGMKKGVIDVCREKDKVFNVPNFSNLELFHSKNSTEIIPEIRNLLSKPSPLLVYTGTFGVINNVPYLVDIAKQLITLNSDVEILIIGDGKELEHIKKYAKEMKVLDVNFFIAPSIAKKDLPQVLAAADLASNIVIDIPEVWNNSANKFFDALAAGVPLLINSGGWQADLIKSENAGLVTHRLTIKESAIRIDAFMHDKNLLKRSSLNAAKLSKKFFNKKKLVRQIEKILILSLEKDNASHENSE